MSIDPSEVEPEAAASEELLQSVVFPQALPKLKTDTETDKTGFTGSEKVALQNAWRGIRRHFMYHATIIFLDFFTENALFLEGFRGPDGKFNLKSLNQHRQTALRTFDRLIEVGLEVPAMIHVILNEVVAHHRRHHISIVEVRLLTYAVRDYLLKAMRPISSPTYEVALAKLCKTIIDFHSDIHSTRATETEMEEEVSY